MALKVTIPEQDCTCVERLWYEYNAALGGAGCSALSDGAA